jgi:uncharacterized protein (DUF2147 family)
MRMAPFASLFLAFGVMAASAAQAEGVTGRWRNPAEAGDLVIYPCGDKICAKGVASDASKATEDAKDVENKNPELRNRSLNGLEVMRGFAGGPRVWSGGSIYRPTDGNTYSGRLELIDPNTLKLTGCVVAMLCQSQTWKRVP